MLPPPPHRLTCATLARRAASWLGGRESTEGQEAESRMTWGVEERRWGGP